MHYTINIFTVLHCSYNYTEGVYGIFCCTGSYVLLNNLDAFYLFSVSSILITEMTQILLLIAY